MGSARKREYTMQIRDEETSLEFPSRNIYLQREFRGWVQGLNGARHTVGSVCDIQHKKRCLLKTISIIKRRAKPPFPQYCNIIVIDIAHILIQCNTEKYGLYCDLLYAVVLYSSLLYYGTDWPKLSHAHRGSCMSFVVNSSQHEAL